MFGLFIHDTQVAARFGLSVGEVQRFQASAATYAGQIRSFCLENGWNAFAAVVAGYQERLEVSREGAAQRSGSTAQRVTVAAQR